MTELEIALRSFRNMMLADKVRAIKDWMWQQPVNVTTALLQCIALVVAELRQQELTTELETFQSAVYLACSGPEQVVPDEIKELFGEDDRQLAKLSVQKSTTPAEVIAEPVAVPQTLPLPQSQPVVQEAAPNQQSPQDADHKRFRELLFLAANGNTRVLDELRDLSQTMLVVRQGAGLSYEDWSRVVRAMNFANNRQTYLVHALDLPAVLTHMPIEQLGLLIFSEKGMVTSLNAGLREHHCNVNRMPNWLIARSFGFLEAVVAYCRRKPLSDNQRMVVTRVLNKLSGTQHNSERLATEVQLVQGLVKPVQESHAVVANGGSFQEKLQKAIETVH